MGEPAGDALGSRMARAQARRAARRAIVLVGEAVIVLDEIGPALANWKARSASWREDMPCGFSAEQVIARRSAPASLRRPSSRG